MARSDAFSYIFGPGTGAETPQQLQRKREIAESILRGANIGSPSNVGEGLTALGQGIASAMGGIAARRADRDMAAGERQAMEQFFRSGLFGGASAGGNYGPVGPSAASPAGGARAASEIQTSAAGIGEMEGYIRQAASARGINPDVAVRVARSEGLAPGVWQSNVVKNGRRETSYGPFQLLVGGGLGDKFQRQHGASPADPSTWRQQIDFALDEAATGGWGPWYGAAKVGVGRRTGLEGARPLGAQTRADVRTSGMPVQVASLDPSIGMTADAGLSDPAPQVPTPVPPPAARPPMPAPAAATPQPAMPGGLPATGPTPTARPQQGFVDRVRGALAGGDMGGVDPNLQTIAPEQIGGLPGNVRLPPAEAAMQQVQHMPQPQQAPMPAPPMQGAPQQRAPTPPPSNTQMAQVSGAQAGGPDMNRINEARTLLQNPFVAANQNMARSLMGIIEQEMFKGTPEYRQQQEAARLDMDYKRGQVRNIDSEIQHRDRSFGLEQGRFGLEREQFGVSRQDTEEDNRLAREKFEWEKGRPTDDIREYEFYEQRERASGRDPLGPLEWDIARRKAGGTSITNNVGGEGLTPGQKKIDEAFADTYLSWQAGGFADSTKQIGQLNEALGILEQGGNITGAIGALPDFVQPFINERGTIAREQVEEVVQRNLREILGAQFTEREGERLIARAFNPRLSPAENAKRVRRLLGQVSSMGQAKQAMVDYFDENGTLRGYRGARPTMNDLNKIDFGDDPPTPAGPPRGPMSEIPPAPGGVDPTLWRLMPPEDRALWQN